MDFQNYVYKKVVDWSFLNGSITLPVDNQVVFGRILNRFLKPGEKKNIKIYIDNKAYNAKIVNVNYSEKNRRKHDTLQIKFSKNGDLANILRTYFCDSYKYLSEKRFLRKKGDTSLIKLPEGLNEYVAIYTTEYDDSYVMEPITNKDIRSYKEFVKDKTEIYIENSMLDYNTGLYLSNNISKIRKLDRKIGDNLKLMYDYRCQICGEKIGEEFASSVVEAHHIDYFIKSLDNNASNQLIVCPNHHRIIHDVNPIFDRERCIYLYENGTEQKLLINKHLNKFYRNKG